MASLLDNNLLKNILFLSCDSKPVNAECPNLTRRYKQTISKNTPSVREFVGFYRAEIALCVFNGKDMNYFLTKETLF